MTGVYNRQNTCTLIVNLSTNTNPQAYQDWNLGCNKQGRSFPRISPESSSPPAYWRATDNAGYWRSIHCATDITHKSQPIVAGNVILIPHRTARMASKQLMNPVRRAIVQRARPTSASVCFQCQRRWQSKVSQRPGSDRYA